MHVPIKGRPRTRAAPQIWEAVGRIWGGRKEGLRRQVGGGGQRPIIRGASDCGARQEVLRGIGPRLLEEGLAAVQHPRRDRDSSGLQGCSGAAREGSPRAP